MPQEIFANRQSVDQRMQSQGRPTSQSQIMQSPVPSLVVNRMPVSSPQVHASSLQSSQALLGRKPRAVQFMPSAPHQVVHTSQFQCLQTPSSSSVSGRSAVLTPGSQVSSFPAPEGTLQFGQGPGFGYSTYDPANTSWGGFGSMPVVQPHTPVVLPPGAYSWIPPAHLGVPHTYTRVESNSLIHHIPPAHLTLRVPNLNLLKTSPKYTRAGVYGKCMLLKSNHLHRLI